MRHGGRPQIAGACATHSSSLAHEGYYLHFGLGLLGGPRPLHLALYRLNLDDCSQLPCRWIEFVLFEKAKSEQPLGDLLPHA